MYDQMCLLLRWRQAGDHHIPTCDLMRVYALQELR
jgi:hypothetical protein